MSAQLRFTCDFKQTKQTNFLLDTLQLTSHSFIHIPSHAAFQSARHSELCSANARPFDSMCTNTCPSKRLDRQTLLVQKSHPERALTCAGECSYASAMCSESQTSCDTQYSQTDVRLCAWPDVSSSRAASQTAFCTRNR